MYLSISPIKTGSFRHNKSRMIRGAPLSERRPDRITRDFISLSNDLLVSTLHLKMIYIIDFRISEFRITFNDLKSFHYKGRPMQNHFNVKC